LSSDLHIGQSLAGTQNDLGTQRHALGSFRASRQQLQLFLIGGQHVDWLFRTSCTHDSLLEWIQRPVYRRFSIYAMNF
jgi:hypothetical protein